MDKIAFVFSGQGAQYPGMGKDLCQEYSAAERIFNAFEALNPGLTGMIFDSTAEDLMKTANTQMALYTVETAVVSVLRDMGIKADDAAGFSLGELSAMPSMLTWMTVIMGLVPAILAVIAVLIISRYPIDQAKRKEIRAYIDEHQAVEKTE